MTDKKVLKKMVSARLKATNVLMKSKDWMGTAYMMGWALECALKAVTCKTLRLKTYPENTRNKEVDNYFMTHRFDRLLVVSGMSDVFSTEGPVDAYRNWSDFTIKYPPVWPEMRYNSELDWDESKVRKLYQNLTDPNNGIITFIRKRW